AGAHQRPAAVDPATCRRPSRHDSDRYREAGDAHGTRRTHQGSLESRGWRTSADPCGKPHAVPASTILSVKDDGIGIAADALPYLFDLFAQSGPATVGFHGGLGIGLSLVKRTVELHGGTVSARSPGLGAGSEFIVRIPAGPSCSS